MPENKIKILDCTLRDGGYYNNWNFKNDLIEEYLLTMKNLDIDYVEIGYRSLDIEGSKGPTAFSTDKFISSLTNRKNINLGIMINASEIINNSLSVLKKLFPSNVKSEISFVRIAAHEHEVAKLKKTIDFLKNKKLKVFVNLMQISEYSTDVLLNKISYLNTTKIDVLYFADSLGNLDKSKINKIIYNSKKLWSKPIGFHFHDNMSRALENSLFCISQGIEYIDSTVCGMGRGPGNLKTEYIINEIKSFSRPEKKLNILQNLLDNFFFELKKKYAWGTNIYYYLSGKYSIHPTYIQQMLSDNRYEAEDIFLAINNLKNNGGKKYNPNTILGANNFFKTKVTGVIKKPSFIKNKEVLVLGPGPNLELNKYEVVNFVKKNNISTIALNCKKVIDEKYVTLRAACHPTRLNIDYKIYNKIKTPFIIPYSMLPNTFIKKNKFNIIYDYGLKISSKEFKINNKFCTLPNLLVVGYVLAFLAASKVSKIYLAGFDGYETSDPRREESEIVFKEFKKINKNIELISVTNTNFNLKKLSLYGLNQ